MTYSWMVNAAYSELFRVRGQCVKKVPSSLHTQPLDVMRIAAAIANTNQRVRVRSVDDRHVRCFAVLSKDRRIICDETLT